MRSNLSLRNHALNHNAPAIETHGGGAGRREAPTGIEPVNSGFAGPVLHTDMTGPWAGTQQKSPVSTRDGRAVAGGRAGFNHALNHAPDSALPSRTPGFFAGLLASIEAAVGPRREVVLPPCACLEPWPVPAYGDQWYCPKCDRFMAPTQGVA